MIDTKSFFQDSELLDYLVLRPLSHIKANWELTTSADKNQLYETEEDSYADLLNQLIIELGRVNPPHRYHDNEDCLAEYVKTSLRWNINKVGNKWIGMEYKSILEQGGFDDLDEVNLVLAASGRIKAAIKRNQHHFDDMETSHQNMLSIVLAIIMYHRS